MTRKPFRRGLRVEGLEDRHMMAGDVTATVAGIRLTITGDLEDNGIVITGLDKQIQVTGLKQDDVNTTVNGNYRATFKNIKEIVIDMGTGDDALVITNGDLKTSFAIDMGDGDDILGLGEFNNKTEYFIPDTQRYESLVDESVDPLLKPFATNSNMSIDLGDGENVLRATAVGIAKNLALISGTGKDKITFEDRGTVGAAGYLPGVVVKLDTAIATGGELDKIRLDRFTTRNLALAGESGNDLIDLVNFTVTKKAEVTGGDGHDAIKLDRFTTNLLRVEGGSGDDDVYTKSVKTSNLAYFDGGTGDNIFHNLEGNSFRLLSWKNFTTWVGPKLQSQINYAKVST